MSAESGIPTYRGEGGIWHKYNWPEYACEEAFQKDPQKVLEFHEMRRNFFCHAILIWDMKLYQSFKKNMITFQSLPRILTECISVPIVPMLLNFTAVYGASGVLLRGLILRIPAKNSKQKM